MGKLRATWPWPNAVCLLRDVLRAAHSRHCTWCFAANLIALSAKNSRNVFRDLGTGQCLRSQFASDLGDILCSLRLFCVLRDLLKHCGAILRNLGVSGASQGNFKCNATQLFLVLPKLRTTFARNKA